MRRRVTMALGRGPLLPSLQPRTTLKHQLTAKQGQLYDRSVMIVSEQTIVSRRLTGDVEHGLTPASLYSTSD
jgi:hypothetical protein